MVTIYDIAKKTGISKSTVSRVVSGNGYVSHKKRQTILNMMHELGYIPNQTAKNLRRQQTMTIGFLVGGYYPLVGEVIDVFINTAAQYGYTVTVYFVNNADEELDVLNLLTTKGLDAVYILTRMNSWNVIGSYASFGPIATWQRVEHQGIYSNYVDHYPIYLQIMKRLYDHGFRQIGHVLSNTRNANTQAREKAITEFSHSHPDTDQSCRFFYSKQVNAGKDAAIRWLSLSNRPNAMIFFADYVAAEFTATLRHHSIQVPKDCFVVGTDNSQISQLMNIPTVDLCFRIQAYNAFIYLYNKLNHKELPFKHQIPRWIDGYSFPNPKKL
ncbi:TPA: LacI family DNA-binding transcriptional regulator [Enterococcus faecium]|nr:LacI family DNA-binding transcriptional regulator [Enterococcus faecium]